MKIYKLKIGDLVVIAGSERDCGVGLVTKTVSNGARGMRDVRVIFKDKEGWYPSFTLRKVRYEKN
jgi:hypothetical protein